MRRADDAYTIMAAGRMNCVQVIFIIYSEIFGLSGIMIGGWSKLRPESGLFVQR
jgi:hypothetical protein